MMFVIIFYFGLLLIALLSWYIWDVRYKKEHQGNIPNDYVKTNEVFIDPVGKNKLRVYFNPKTGDRIYCKDN